MLIIYNIPIKNYLFITNRNVLQSNLLPKIEYKHIVFILIFVFFYNILCADVLYAMESNLTEGELRDTIQFYQDEIAAIKSMLIDQGLDVEDNKLTYDQQACKAEYNEALEDSKAALSSNISKLRNLKLDEAKEILGKRVAEDSSSNLLKKR
jgi:hypothetical protein